MFYLLLRAWSKYVLYKNYVTFTVESVNFILAVVYTLNVAKSAVPLVHNTLAYIMYFPAFKFFTFSEKSGNE